MLGSQASWGRRQQGSAWRVVGWGRGWGWGEDSCLRSPSRAEGLAGALAAWDLSSFNAGERGEQRWEHRGLGGQMCNSGESWGHRSPRDVLQQLCTETCGLLGERSTCSHSKRGAGGLQPRHVNFPDSQAVTEKGFIVSVGKVPLQRAVTPPERCPEGTLRMQPGSEPRNRCQCQQLLLEKREKPQQFINSGIYRFGARLRCFGKAEIRKFNKVSFQNVVATPKPCV